MLCEEFNFSKIFTTVTIYPYTGFEVGNHIFVSDRLLTLIAFEGDFIEYVHRKPMWLDWVVVRSAVRTLFFVLQPGSHALSTMEHVALAALHWIPHNMDTNLANELMIEIRITTFFWLDLNSVFLKFVPTDSVHYVCNLALNGIEIRLLFFFYGIGMLIW